jgi:hypothetical protein
LICFSAAEILADRPKIPQKIFFFPYFLCKKIKKVVTPPQKMTSFVFDIKNRPNNYFSFETKLFVNPISLIHYQIIGTILLWKNLKKSKFRFSYIT